jgi:CBS domain-containing protein
VTAKAPTVAQIMATAPRTIDRNASLELADEMVGDARIRHLPVVDGGMVVGVLSQRDLFQGALAHALGYGSVSRSRILRTIPVKEVMSEPAVTVQPDTTVREAARLMVSRKIGCLPVVDAGHLVGLVTETDVVRHAFGV